MNTLLLAEREETTFVIARRLRWRDRARARLTAPRLDRLLANGVSPDSSPALSLRARRLIGRAARAEVARALRRVQADARRSHHPLDPRLPVSRARVLESTDTIDELAEALAGVAPVAAQGVAQARLLVTEGGSPLYARGEADLQRALVAAATALTPGACEPPGWDLVDA